MRYSQLRLFVAIALERVAGCGGESAAVIVEVPLDVYDVCVGVDYYAVAGVECHGFSAVDSPSDFYDWRLHESQELAVVGTVGGLTCYVFTELGSSDADLLESDEIYVYVFLLSESIGCGACVWRESPCEHGAVAQVGILILNSAANSICE